MVLSLSKEELKVYLGDQLNCFFPDKYKLEGDDIEKAFDIALDRLEYCFQDISFASYSNEFGQTFFSHLHADQYAQFLYFFSNSLWEISQNQPICDKTMYLNRILNNFFFSYKCKLPEHFFLGHPIGTVIGNAVYNDHLVIFQNVTINTSKDENGNMAPILGKGLFLGTGAKIIGNKRIGDRVSIGVDVVLYNQEIDDDKVVIKKSDGNIVVKNRIKDSCFAQSFFRSII